MNRRTRSAADVVSEFAGVDLTNEELGQAAQLRQAGRLQDFDIRTQASTRRHILESSIRRNEEFLQRKTANQRERRRRLAMEVQQVLGQSGGDSSALAKFSEPFLSPDQDPQEFARRFQTVGTDVEEVGFGGASLSAIANQFTGNGTVRIAGPQPVQFLESDAVRLPAREVGQMRTVLQAILAEIKRTNSRPQTTVANQTVIAPDANRYVTNGETVAAGLEP